MEYNKFSSYMQMKRDSSITDPVNWWKGSRTLYPKLSKMARDVLAVPATGTGVEREFSISGRVVTKQRNCLAPSTIRDIMQYKRWVLRHGIAIPEEDISRLRDEQDDNDQMEYDAEHEYISGDDEDEEESGVAEWLRDWSKREAISSKVGKLIK
jgi:hAT family C-terminal dimerisation region